MTEPIALESLTALAEAVDRARHLGPVAVVLAYGTPPAILTRVRHLVAELDVTMRVVESPLPIYPAAGTALVLTRPPLAPPGWACCHGRPPQPVDPIDAELARLRELAATS